jgi:multidrug efflux pump subunit AcrA (membrane-fusion protein)
VQNWRKTLKRKTLIWSVIILLIVVLAGSVAYYTISVQSNENGLSSVSGETLTQTAVARQGDLIVFASGTGQLVSLDESTLQFDENGTLVELLVSVGDQVMAGDVLARLQVNKSETQRTADIAKAELALLENQ